MFRNAVNREKCDVISIINRPIKFATICQSLKFHNERLITKSQIKNRLGIFEAMALPLSGSNRKSMLLGWPSTNFGIKTAPNSGTLIIPPPVYILLTPECGIIECLAALRFLASARFYGTSAGAKSGVSTAVLLWYRHLTLHLPLKITPDSTIKELIIGEAFTQQEIESLEVS